MFDLDNTIYILGDSDAIRDYYRDDAYFQSFYGWVKLDEDKVRYADRLPWVDSYGYNGRLDYPIYSQRSAGGATALVDICLITNTLFLGFSNYISASKYYIVDKDATRDCCIFNTYYELYEFGCHSYYTMTNGISIDSMLNWYAYDSNNVATIVSDLYGRNAISLHSNYTYFIPSLGSNSNYVYSANMHCRSFGSSHFDNVIIADIDTSLTGMGLSLGFNYNDLYLCVRTSEDDFYIISKSLNDLGISINDWVDIGFSFESKPTTSGCMVLYVNGYTVASGEIPPGYSYSANRTDFARYDRSILDNTKYVVSYFYLTDFSYYKRILDESEFAKISCINNNLKPLAPRYFDYGIIHDGYIPQPILHDDRRYYRYNAYQKDIVHSVNDSYMYVIGDRAICRYDYNTNNWKSVGNWDIVRSRLITAVEGNNTYSPVAIVRSSHSMMPITLELDHYRYESNSYVVTGSYVTPIIDTKQDSMFFYNIDFNAEYDSYVDIYIRYSNYPPLDYAHVCYCDSTAIFREMSIATGKLFYTIPVLMNKSCAVYYDKDRYLVTFDGKVYMNGDYLHPVYSFGMLSYQLSDVIGTWFSSKGTFVLYYTSEGFLVGFPLGLGYACSTVTVRFTVVYEVFWEFDKDYFSVSTDYGVFIFNYKLGFIESNNDYIHCIFMPKFNICITAMGEVHAVSKNWLEHFVVDVTDLSAFTDIKVDYQELEVYYISTVDNELKKFSVDYNTKITSVYNLNVYHVSMIDSIGINSVCVVFLLMTIVS